LHSNAINFITDTELHRHRSELTNNKSTFKPIIHTKYNAEQLEVIHPFRSVQNHIHPVIPCRRDMHFLLFKIGDSCIFSIWTNLDPHTRIDDYAYFCSYIIRGAACEKNVPL
jgi:hypothetical protein